MSADSRTDVKRSRLGKIFLLAFIAAAAAAFFIFHLDQYVTLAALKENKETLKAYTETHYNSTVILYILIYCLQTAISLPGAAILTLAGGFLFGALLGTVYVNVGATSGAVLAFLAVRYLLQDMVERKFGARLLRSWGLSLCWALWPLCPPFIRSSGRKPSRNPERLKSDLRAHVSGVVEQAFDAIMTDTDNTRESATAYYGDIVFKKE